MGRREQKAAIRNSILEAAGAIFHQQGYQDAAMRAIASQAGVRLAQLYSYFPSKAKLFIATLEHVALVQRLQLSAEDIDSPPAEFLPRVVEFYEAQASRTETIALLRAALADPERDAELVEVISETLAGRLLGPLTRYFGRQMELGRLYAANPEYMAQIFLGPLIALNLRRCLLGESASLNWSLPGYAAAALQVFMHGTEPEAGNPAAAVERPNPAADEYSLGLVAATS